MEKRDANVTYSQVTNQLIRGNNATDRLHGLITDLRNRLNRVLRVDEGVGEPMAETGDLVELATDMRAINDSVFHAANRIADILDQMELP